MTGQSWIETSMLGDRTWTNLDRIVQIQVESHRVKVGGDLIFKLVGYSDIADERFRIKDGFDSREAAEEWMDERIRGLVWKDSAASLAEPGLTG